jgi:hypothetical protein
MAAPRFQVKLLFSREDTPLKFMLYLYGFFAPKPPKSGASARCEVM